MTLTLEKKTYVTFTNEKLVIQVLQELMRCGVTEICLCPGKRNAPFATALDKLSQLKTYFWPEERSAAFFALGRSKLTRRPTAVITTSGTAAAELLPAAMEAYYTGVPLILLTADRPRSFRGTGAPQAAEQVGLFSHYTVYEQDLANEEEVSLRNWQQNGPAHLNICLDEPLTQIFDNLVPLNTEVYSHKKSEDFEATKKALDHFLQSSRFPLVVVSAIEEEAQNPLVTFLQDYKAPVYLEGVSGLREDPRLRHLRITRTDNLWKAAEKANYPIDGILRIGGVPTFRLWRDLEDLSGKVQVCSISDQPFSGLHWGSIQTTPLDDFFNEYMINDSKNDAKFKVGAVNRDCRRWLAADQEYANKLSDLLHQESQSEAALVCQLSKQIPSEALVYLGNSLPIREWDAYAATPIKHPHVFASRGVCGIDGQISTFFGMCRPDRQNWGIIGDLTAVYDLAAPWILQQMQEIDLNLVIINNGGGKIFARMFPLKQMQNPHKLHFKSLAELWGMRYECYTHLPEKMPYGGHRLIEIIPDEDSTVRFWNGVADI
jgi:2-succinyl-5-enolpyruvyl-6-hydroxy-3-cyclohexene-1-carboxylate synthase